ncbi:MAG TPA: hypothetical protein VIV11_19940 [Kofleriaceae bacterium]
MRYAWFVLLAIGCYEAPDYSGTRFKCDSEHACPNNQPCVNGFCSAGSGSNMIDSGMPPQVGIACGSATCSGSQKCCVDFVSGPACVAATTSCTGFLAACDGKEDCGGSFCCDISGTVIECATICTNSVICRDNADCPTTLSQCCPPTTQFEPWGRCNIACP